MNAPFVVLVLLALGVAGADWLAVAHGNRRMEHICKPGVMVLLILAALVLHPASELQRAWFVGALLLGLAGDVFLMQERDMFVYGLAAFLLGHLAYIAGFIAPGIDAARAVVVLTFLMIIGAVVVQRVMRGVRREGKRGMVPAVAAYSVVITLMVAMAFASRQPLAVIPALLFYASDMLISFRRFLSPRPWMPLTIIVTYHLAQVGLVLSLAPTG